MEYAKFTQYRVSNNDSNIQDSDFIDCSDHVPSNDNLGRLNEYYQKNRQEPIEVVHTKTGPDHIPLFVCDANYQGKTFRASAQTKKEAEKKVKSYIYENLINPTPTRKFQAPAPQTTQTHQTQIKVLPQKQIPVSIIPQEAEEDTITGAYEHFRELLKRSAGSTKPILIIDLVSIDIGTLLEAEIQDYCKKKFSRVVMYSNQSYLEWKNTIVLTTMEQDTGTNHESINRITYFLLDNNYEKEICILTRNKYPLLTTVASKTNQKVTVINHLDLKA